MRVRLFDTQRWRFWIFDHKEIPPYCILSHRWGREEGEISYADICSRNWKEGSSAYKKLVGACKEVNRLGLRWIWVDTFCINKDSDTELSEAIRSMYEWYANAEICLAYLFDIRVPPAERNARSVSHLRESSWFRRSWTLQELLAPQHVRFYDCDFNFIGTKRDRHLIGGISSITGIEACYLQNPDEIHEASIATRISWASKRRATRKEDEAYCLLGLLQVHMPLLYGEGDRAFFRLQCEVINTCDDDSIFAWIPEGVWSNNEPFGMLASSPRDFARSGNIDKVHIAGAQRQPYRCTSRGLEIRRPEFSALQSVSSSQIRLALACKNREHGDNTLLAVKLRKVDGLWYRTNCCDFLYKQLENESMTRLAYSHDIGVRARLGRVDTLYVAQPELKRRNSRESRNNEIARVSQARENHRRNNQGARIVAAGALALTGAVVSGPVISGAVLLGAIGIDSYLRVNWASRERRRQREEADRRARSEERLRQIECEPSWEEPWDDDVFELDTQRRPLLLTAPATLGWEPLQPNNQLVLFRRQAE